MIFLWWFLDIFLIETYIGQFTSYSKLTILAILEIFQGISYWQIVKKKLFKDWILITHMEPCQNQLMHEWK